MRSFYKNFIVKALYETAISYPAPSNLNYFWNFGIYALICLAIQIITGIFLAMHFAPNIDLAFLSVEHIMRDVNFGYLLRYLHANGASMFFIVVYIHTFRGLYYSSFVYPREWLWIIGALILFLMIVTAFLGYVLPWGQMSFLAATVITNLFSAIPFIGQEIVIWLWGGYSIDNSTLNRFFSLHYILPFIILGLVALHLLFLHDYKSNNPLGIEADLDSISFFPYYILKDLYGVLLFLAFFIILLAFNPNLLGHPDNYIPANPLVTPAHIVPEWYFLPFYAILRSIPDKLFGVLALLSAILILVLLPYLNKSKIRNSNFRPLNKIGFWIFLINAFILGYIGSKPAEYPFVQIGQIATLFYFFYFIFLTPLLNNIEEKINIKKVEDKIINFICG
jgi:quinol-cytochrome oxidoreductase complex cytochrome b subunit